MRHGHPSPTTKVRKGKTEEKRGKREIREKVEGECSPRLDDELPSLPHERGEGRGARRRDRMGVGERGSSDDRVGAGRAKGHHSSRSTDEFSA